MFSTLPKTDFNFSITFILSSANVLSFDQPKSLFFGNGLTLYQTMRKDSSVNDVGKGENVGNGLPYEKQTECLE